MAGGFRPFSCVMSGVTGIARSQCSSVQFTEYGAHNTTHYRVLIELKRGWVRGHPASWSPGLLAASLNSMKAPSISLERPALVVVDVQAGFDDSDFWGPRDNPLCESNIAALVGLWRSKAWPIVFVRHDSDNAQSPLSPSGAGHAFKDILEGTPDLLISKRVNSSFYGTPDLDAWLRNEGIDQVVICGITTNHCCETTARMAGNLGYDTYFVIDATHTFDRVALDGTTVPAATLSAITATNLHGEFATVVTTEAMLSN